MGLALFAFPHRTAAMSMRPLLPWAPLPKAHESCSHTPKAGGAVWARGYTNEEITSLNAIYGDVLSSSVKSLVVS